MTGTTITRIIRCARKPLLLAILAVAFEGCKHLSWTESDFREREPVWKSSSAKSPVVSDAAGLSRKAREVERNLGVE